MWTCSSCKEVNRDSYRFCIYCGSPRPLEQKKKPQPAPDPGRAPSSRPNVKSEARRQKPRAQKSDAHPSAEEEGAGSPRTILLLLFALVLVAAVVAIILVFPRLSDRAGAAREESVESGRSTRRSSSEDGESDPESEGGGTSTFVFGSESAVPALPTDQPGQSASPEATGAPSATPSPVPSAEPTPSPTPAPAERDYLIPGSDSRYLTDNDLEDLTWEQCTLARNEIYARHGRIFVTKAISDYFNGKSWYHGTVGASYFNESVLNEFERANVNFILQYETSHWGGSFY